MRLWHFMWVNGHKFRFWIIFFQFFLLCLCLSSKKQNGEELKSQGDELKQEKFAMVRSVDALDVDILELNNEIGTRANVDESMESLNDMKFVVRSS